MLPFFVGIISANLQQTKILGGFFDLHFYVGMKRECVNKYVLNGLSKKR